MVEPLVEYINDEAPFHATPSLRNFYRRRWPLPHNFWTASNAMERAGQPMLESLKWRREQLSKGVLSDELPSELDDQIEKLETALRVIRELRTLMFPANYGKKRERWHELANALIPYVKDIYSATGRRTVDFQTSTGAGVKAICWVLERFGYSVSLDAIAQHLKRARKAGTIRLS